MFSLKSYLIRGLGMRTSFKRTPLLNGQERFPRECPLNAGLTEFYYTRKNLPSCYRVRSLRCCLNNAWTTLWSWLKNIVEPTILFSIVSTIIILFRDDEAPSLIMVVGTGKFCIDRTTIFAILMTCLFELVNKLLQQWWLNNFVTCMFMLASSKLFKVAVLGVGAFSHLYIGIFGSSR